MRLVAAHNHNTWLCANRLTRNI